MMVHETPADPAKSGHEAADRSARHVLVLESAMELIAERGLKGASLRELARRVELTQPSLYHYFESKDDLVRQILGHYSAATMDAADVPTQVESFRELLRTALVFIADLYRQPSHTTWVRFLFAVTMERPEFGSVLRDRLIERGMALAMRIGSGCVDRQELLAQDLRPALELATGAVTMRLLEEHVLNTGPRQPGGQTGDLKASYEATLQFIDFVVDAVAFGVERRRQHFSKD